MRVSDIFIEDMEKWQTMSFNEYSRGYCQAIKDIQDSYLNYLRNETKKEQ